jgi:hypothetical protein
MSTKTTFKRIALVTVAALGFGVLSTVPSSAVHQADKLTLSATTAAQTTAETYTATSATATLTFTSSGEADSLSVTASIVDAPAGSTAYPWLRLIETSSAVAAGTAAKLKTAYANKTDILNAGDANALTAFVSSSAGASSVTAVSAKFAVFMASSSDVTAAPAKAGTYTIKLTPAVAGGGGALQSTAQTLTITVTAAAALDTVPSAALSTVSMAIGETSTTAVAGVDDVISAAKSVGTDAVATIKVTQLNAAGAAANESMTVTIAGSGTLTSIVASTTPNNGSATGARAITVKNGDLIQVWADGSAGTGTITITSTTSNVVLATKSVTFFSTTVAKITAVVKKAYVLAGGTATDGSSAATASNTNSRVFLVNAFDADGRDMASGAGTITVKPTSATTDALIGAAGVCTYANKTTKAAAGYYCSAPGVSSTKFGKVNYTFTATKADLTTVTTTADVTFSDKVATKITVTGPASAGVGELVTLTYTATEKNGYPVADTSYDGVETNRAIWGDAVYSSASFAPFGLGETITTVSGVATQDVYVPVTSGTVKATWTLAGDGTAAVGGVAKAISYTDVVYSLTVTNPGVDAAAAAAEEATAAANDATDAALSAAEAAEAATAMAQEAVDAVAELSASVTKLISALRAQITTLTNLVVKIQKKVKA